MYSKSIQRAIEIFSKFPTVGPKTAARFAFYLKDLSENEVEQVLDSIRNLKKNIKTCSFCFRAFESEEKGNLCSICQDPSRDRTILCVVEKEQDLDSIEKTDKYKGLYFILGGTVPVLKKDSKKIREQELKERVLNPKKYGVLDANFKEIVLAPNPTTEGQATIFHLKRFLKPLNIKITSLGLGLPRGGELEYADEETVTSALQGRGEL